MVTEPPAEREENPLWPKRRFLEIPVRQALPTAISTD